eukprot:GGOE01021389.1.p1 GENE.GGOE01021389.1~~GGOE01021389.1.p1  ORF type:complete len:970 (+),score=249.66 GGOE01021389.1:46-2955(+)
MVILAKPRKAAPSGHLQWRRVESYNHEAFSVQKRKEGAALLRSRSADKFRILYHEAPHCWIIATCEDPKEVWNDWCYILQQPRLQEYDLPFRSPSSDASTIPDPISPSLVTQHKFVKLQVRERVWCNVCKASILMPNAKECLYCKFVVHDKCTDAVERHPQLKFCQVAQNNSGKCITYEARLCFEAKDALKAMTSKETLLEVDTERRTLVIRTAGLSSMEFKIQDLQVTKSQKERAKFRLFHRVDGEKEELCRGRKFEMLSAAVLENFCSTMELLDPNQPQSTTGPNKEDCSLFIFSWNMGNCRPNVNSLRHVLPSSGHDLIVIGVQECEYQAQSRQSRSTEADWFRTIEEILEENYSRVGGMSLWHIRLLIFVAKASAHKITKVKRLKEGTGIVGVAGNKGAAGISIQYMQSEICFVASHFAAHQEHLDSRRRDYCDIIGGLSSGLSASKYLDLLHAFDYLFWFGDLNYRLNMPRPDVMKCIKAKDYAKLMETDQLELEMKKKLVFQGFETSTPAFPPTYKYIPGKYPREYDDVKQRIPSYTDRILWRCHPPNAVTPLELRCFDNVFTSDHNPVAQAFSIRISRQFILADDAFATRRAIRIHEMTVHQVGLLWFKVKFFSRNLDGKWQTTTSKLQRWSADQIPLLHCILGVVEFIEEHPLFFLLWDTNMNRSRGQGMIDLKGLAAAGKKKFTIQLLHEGTDVGRLSGTLSLEEVAPIDELEQPVPGIIVLGECRKLSDDALSERSPSWTSDLSSSATSPALLPMADDAAACEDGLSVSESSVDLAGIPDPIPQLEASSGSTHRLSGMFDELSRTACRLISPSARSARNRSGDVTPTAPETLPASSPSSLSRRTLHRPALLTEATHRFSEYSFFHSRSLDSHMRLPTPPPTYEHEKRRASQTSSLTPMAVGSTCSPGAGSALRRSRSTNDYHTSDPPSPLTESRDDATGVYRRLSAVLQSKVRTRNSRH